jgi:tetratricopeptide (TPR) repeat protein
MSLYNQIGYLYSQLNMHHAAIDYFKKQLITAWQHNNIKNEMLAYEHLSIANYYLGEEDNIERALKYSERFYARLREDSGSVLR